MEPIDTAQNILQMACKHAFHLSCVLDQVSAMCSTRLLNRVTVSYPVLEVKPVKDMSCSMCRAPFLSLATMKHSPVFAEVVSAILSGKKSALLPNGCSVKLVSGPDRPITYKCHWPTCSERIPFRMGDASNAFMDHCQKRCQHVTCTDCWASGSWHVMCFHTQLESIEAQSSKRWSDVLVDAAKNLCLSFTQPHIHLSSIPFVQDLLLEVSDFTTCVQNQFKTTPVFSERFKSLLEVWYKERLKLHSIPEASRGLTTNTMRILMECTVRIVPPIFDNVENVGFAQTIPVLLDHRRGGIAKTPCPKERSLGKMEDHLRQVIGTCCFTAAKYFSDREQELRLQAQGSPRSWSNMVLAVCRLLIAFVDFHLALEEHRTEVTFPPGNAKRIAGWRAYRRENPDGCVQLLDKDLMNVLLSANGTSKEEEKEKEKADPTLVYQLESMMVNREPMTITQIKEQKEEHERAQTEAAIQQVESSVPIPRPSGLLRSDAQMARMQRALAEPPLAENFLDDI